MYGSSTAYDQTHRVTGAGTLLRGSQPHIVYGSPYRDVNHGFDVDPLPKDYEFVVEE